MGRIERSLSVYVTLDSKSMAPLETPLFEWLSAIHMLVDERRKRLSPHVELPRNSVEGKRVGLRMPKKVFLEDVKNFKALLDPAE